MRIPDRLDKNVILGQMSPLACETFTSLEVLQSVDSTNHQIRSFMSGSVLLAEEQTKGKGRHGNQWASPFAEGIYLSILLSRDKFSNDLDGLSLAVAVMANNFFAEIAGQQYTQSTQNMKALRLEKFDLANKKAMTAKLGVKWPNDLFVVTDTSVAPSNKNANQASKSKEQEQNKRTATTIDLSSDQPTDRDAIANGQNHSKLGGILTEIDDGSVIIGIGINYYSNKNLQSPQNKSFYQRTSVSKIFGSSTPPRSDACGILLNHLARGLSSFCCDGFTPFQQKWNNINILQGKRVIIKQGNISKQGVCDGVDEHGNLILRNGKQITKIASGSVATWD